MADAHLDTLLSACREHDGGEPSQALRRATADFLHRAANDVGILKAAAAALPNLTPDGAAWLAVAIGAVIERGDGVDHTAPAVVDLFLSWLPRLSALDDKHQKSTESLKLATEQAELLRAFPPLCQSVVAHLARTPGRRAQLAQDMQLLDRLEELESHSHGAVWVREMLLRKSGLLVLLHQPSGMGFRLRYDNVANCFHLFSLIQTAIGRRIPDGRRPDAAIAAAARGRPGGRLADEAWWHYSNHRSRTADIGASIWGEASVLSIPSVNGVQVIVLWSPILAGRMWDSTFFGPQLDALPPDVVVEEELTAENARSWFDRLEIEAGGRRKSQAALEPGSGIVRPPLLSARFGTYFGSLMLLAAVWAAMLHSYDMAAAAGLLGLVFTFAAAPQVVWRHEVCWNQEGIEGPAKMFGLTLGAARTGIAWVDIARVGRTITGYWYVESSDGSRVYWSYLGAGHEALAQALRAHCPTLQFNFHLPT
jgi:hypothetical protein